MSKHTDAKRLQQETVAAAFDQRAATYDQSALHVDLAEAIAGFALLTGVRVVLDVATGTGLVLRAFAARSREPYLVGVDISPGMLASAQRALPTGIFVEGAAERLPVCDQSIDLVTCATALHLVSEPDVVFAEFSRVLTPNGRVLLATFQRAPDRSYIDRPYATNHRAFETADLVAECGARAGLVLTRSATGLYGDEQCLITELARVAHLKAMR